MKAITDAEKRRREEQQISESTTRKKEKVNPPEEAGAGSKPTLQPIDLSNLIEPESEEEN